MLPAPESLETTSGPVDRTEPDHPIDLPEAIRCVDAAITECLRRSDPGVAGARYIRKLFCLTNALTALRTNQETPSANEIEQAVAWMTIALDN